MRDTSSTIAFLSASSFLTTSVTSTSDCSPHTRTSLQSTPRLVSSSEILLSLRPSKDSGRLNSSPRLSRTSATPPISAARRARFLSASSACSPAHSILISRSFTAPISPFSFLHLLVINGGISIIVALPFFIDASTTPLSITPVSPPSERKQLFAFSHLPQKFDATSYATASGDTSVFPPDSADKRFFISSNTPASEYSRIDVSRRFLLTTDFPTAV